MLFGPRGQQAFCTRSCQLLSSKGHTQTAVGMSGGDSSGPSLASQAMVCRPNFFVAPPWHIPHWADALMQGALCHPDLS